MENNEEISAVEAAIRLGVSRERVIRWVQVGELPGRRDAGLGWRVNLAAVERMKTTAA